MIELTKTNVKSIISGTAEHSPLAEDFIDQAKKLHGVDIKACYLQTLQYLSCFHDESRKPKKFKFALFNKHKSINTKNAYPINDFCLIVYVSNIGSRIDKFKEEFGDKLISLLKDIISSHGMYIEYGRYISQREMDYYGWTDQQKAEWDMSKVIHSDRPAVERDRILVESYDHIVMWNLLCDKSKKISALPIMESIGAKAYCGWDEAISSPTLYIILPEGYSAGEDEQESVTSEILSYLHSKDTHNVICDELFRPIFTTWSALPEKLRFALLR